MKKIIICIPSLRLGGAAKIALNLSEHFYDIGADVTILLTAGSSREIEFTERPAGVKIISLPHLRKESWLGEVVNRFKPFHRLLWLINCFREVRPTFILSVRHEATAFSYLAWLLALKPGSFYIREITPIDKYLTKSKYRLRLLKLAYSSANAIIANSNYVATALEKKKWTDSKNIFVIDNPVLSKGFFQKANENIEDLQVRDSNIPLIMTIGRLSEVKDHYSLIKAFEVVREEVDCDLMIIGEGNERDNLQNLIDSLQLAKHVRLAGAIENPYPYLKKANLFVLTSKYEGFGIVLVEALALGKKVVSTNCSSGPAYILNNGEFGKLVNVGDIHDIAKAIRESLHSPADPEKLIQRAKDFSVSVIGKKYWDIMVSCQK